MEDASHAVIIFDIVPQDEGVYAKRNDPDCWYNIWWEDAAYYMTFTSYCILKTVAPELDANTICRTFTYRPDEDVRDAECRHIYLGTPRDIDYGIVEKTFDQFVNMPEICDDDDANSFWTYLLSYSDLTDEEILDVAWNGEGNLWAFVRPDR